MKERPILMSAPMVRAILAGRKTQTRRVVKGVDECPHGYDGVVRATVPQEAHLVGKHCFYLASGESAYLNCPYGVPGDRLWVRENGWQRPERTPKMMREGADTWPKYEYDADEPDHEQNKEMGWKRRPSIHMPRWACRIVLEVTKVRVERLQDITAHDAEAEGCQVNPAYPQVHSRALYHALWQSINGNWSANPWVWVVEFKREGK